MSEWIVEFTLAGAPSEDELIELEDHFAEKRIDASVSALPGLGQWTLTLDAGDNIFLRIRTVMDDVATFIDLARYPLAAVEARTLEELERRVDRPTMPKLLGASEVGDILGVTRQRVHQLRDQPAFPHPLVEVAMGPLWDARAIEKFARGWTRRPGRPTSRPSEVARLGQRKGAERSAAYRSAAAKTTRRRTAAKTAQPVAAKASRGATSKAR